MIKFRIVMEGTAPLIVHNGRLANPIDPATKALKAVTGKRAKTDDDHEEMARLEFLGGLYFDETVGPYLPSDNVWRCLYDAAKRHKLGPRLKEGLFLDPTLNPIGYRGPRDVAGLWTDPTYRFTAPVVVQRNRVMRTRPIFRSWLVSAEGTADPQSLDIEQVRMIAETAGSLIGMGEWRPQYGRFMAQIESM
jgi:hypothetical protein